MINKKNIWFLTLFSLILVLSVYYITMPKELLLTNIKNIGDITETDNEKVELDTSDVITAMKVENEEEKEKQLDELKQIINDTSSDVNKKNEAFDKMKSLDINSSKEEEISSKIKEEFKYNTFTKIEGDKIKITVANTEKDTKKANDIMRFVQKMFDTKKYITVEFK